MKDISNRQSERRSWRTTALTTAVLTALSMTSVSVNSATNRAPIGDLEIYDSAEGGNITIMMMLDTSGSMTNNQVDYACDLPENTPFTKGSEPSSTTPSYPRNYCSATVKKYYFARSTSKLGANKWYRCADSGSGSLNTNSCNIKIKAPSTTGYQSTGNNPTYYYQESSKNEKVYDRLTRLKDAIFTLMDNASLDPKKVAIGIGQFSSQSDNNNTYTGADGTSGKILVPAALVGPAQRTAIKNAVALLNGENGTPTANAYAEAGAYMLGTNTSVSITYPREEYVKFENNFRYYKCTSHRGEKCTGYSNSNKDSINNPSGYTSAQCGAYNTGTICLSTNKTQSAKDWEFSGFEKSFKNVKLGANYISPLATSTTATCDGRGIYFLTDGVPNSSPVPLPLMRAALRANSFAMTSQNRLLEGSTDNSGKYTGGMPEVGAFAKALRDPALNPLGKNNPILTAVVGFGSDFNVDRNTDALLPEADRVIRTLSYTNARGEEQTGDFYNCNNITDIDAKNACNWGAKSHPDLPNVGNFGEGGFYSAQSTEDIITSITTFVDDLDQTLSSAPSGTITIPDDPYQVSNQLAYAYLPMLAPNISSKNSIWKGNLKKYSLSQGTLFGKSNKRLYTNVAGDISKTTQDVWQTTDFKNIEGEVANDDISAGGVYAQLRSPKSGRSSVRKIYVEDYENLANKKPILRELSVDNAGKPIGFNLLVDANAYTQQNQRRLLNFLGFTEADSKEGEQIDLVSTSNAALPDLITSDLTLVQPAKDIKVLGGVVHSTPTAISYSATLDENGRIIDPRDDYVLFGSMDGALHLVDVDNGEEAFAIIPRQMLINQPEALVNNSTSSNGVGVPYFGVDAPWLVTTDYKYDLKGKKVIVDDSTGNGIFAYGGLRMGGQAFYGMDITKSTAPKALFTITPEGLNGSASTVFARLGQIWSKPTAAKIRLTKGKDPIDVLVFGGGYDMQYESDEYMPTSTTTPPPAKGNAIYIINAKSGELIWSASNSANTGTTVTSNINDGMIHSMTGEITVLDRDNDGLMDHLYAADLGGQVFRADFINARPEKFGFSAVDNFSTKHFTRILDTTPTAVADKKFAYRFYERPIISFYRKDSGLDNGKLFALVNVVSGNRSAPLSKLRDDNKYANRVYGIIDSDVTRGDLLTGTNIILGVNNLTESSLVNLATALDNAPTESTALKTLKDKVKDSVAAKNGWYYPLIRFDGKNNVKYNKSLGDSVVIDRSLYTTVYNPDKQYGSVNSCTAKVRGGSERQLYCLPYGICMDPTSKTGTGGFIPAGQGIQELALGAFNKDNTNLKVLIGTTPIAERISAGNRVDYNGGGDGSAVEYIFNERYTLQPKAWYERQQ